MIKHLLPLVKGNFRRYGLLLSIFVLGTIGALALGNAYSDAGLAPPTVVSDKDDYLPGEVAIITGKGWKLDSIVDVHFEETPAYHLEHQHDYHGVTVDAEGNWMIKYPIEERHRGVHFTVHVVGKQTRHEAQTTFTDGDIPVTVNLTLWSQLDRDLTPGNGIQSPTAEDRVIVKNGATLIVDVNNAVCGNLQLGDNGGNTAGNGTIRFHSESSKLTVSSAATATLTGAGNVILGGAGNRTGSIDMGAGGNLRVSGSFTITSLGTFTPGTGTIEFNGINQAIPSFSALGNKAYNFLILSGSGTKTLGGNITVTKDLTIGSGATLNAGANTMEIAGNVTNNGTINPATGTVHLNGTFVQTISGLNNTAFNKLIVNNNAGIIISQNASVNSFILQKGKVSLGNIVLNIQGSNSNIDATNGEITYMYSDSYINPVIKFQNSATITGSMIFDVNVHINNGTVNFSSNSNIKRELRIASANAIISSPPLYDIGSTLHYQGVGSYLRGAEWSSIVGNGSPYNVAIHTQSSLLMGANPAQINGALALNTNGTLDMGNSSHPLVVSDLLLQTSDATLILSTNTSSSLNINGKGQGFQQFFSRGNIIQNGRKIVLSGSGDLNLITNKSIQSLVLDRTSGNVIISDYFGTRDLTISGSLTFGASNKANIIAENGTLAIVNNLPSSLIKEGDGLIIGKLQRAIAAGTNSYLFPVGENSKPTPVTLDINNATTTGNLTVSTLTAVAPVASGVSQTKYVNRKWTILNNGVAFSNSNATFNFVPDDLIGSPATNSFIIGKLDGSTWSSPTVGTKTATSTQASGLTSFGDFYIGETATQNTATNLASSSNPAKYGEPVTFTATVTTNPASANVPVGSVQFFTGNVALGSPVTLNTSGVATFEISSLAVSSTDGHSITATYIPSSTSFNGSISTAIAQVVNKATATITLASLSHTYNGSSKLATATTDPAGLTTIGFTYAPITQVGGVDQVGTATSEAPKNAGRYQVVATLANDNYSGSATEIFSIGRAPSTIAVIGGNTFTYNAAAQGSDEVTKSGSNGAVTFSYSGTSNGNVAYASATKPTLAGTYSVTATLAGDGNHEPATSAPFAFTIGKASTTTDVTIAPGTFTFTGSAITPASVTVISASGLNLTPAASYANNINAGTATASYTYAGDDNHTGSNDSKTFEIGKAATTTVVTLAAGPFTYTGSAITPATVRVTGAGGLNITPAAVYTNNVNAGTATASYSYAATGNYEASSDSKTFEIGKATATLALGNLSHTYNGTVKSATATTLPAGLSGVSISNNGQINADSYPVIASLTNDNYQAENVTGNLVIAKAPTTTEVTAAGGMYTGSAIGGSASVTGAGGLSQMLVVTYEGTGATTYPSSTTAPVNAGAYQATAGYAESTNHLASSDTETFTIGKATATVVVAGKTVTYDGSAHGASGTAKGVNNEDLTGLDLGASFTNVPGGTANWTFTNANYADQSGSVSIAITAKPITGSFTASDKEYDGSTAATVTGRSLSGVVASDAATVTLTGGTATFSDKNVAPGKTVTLIDASLSGTAVGNYTLASVATTTAAITAKEVTASITASNKVYDGNTTAAITGRSLAGVLAADAANVSLGTSGTASFATATAENGKTVTATGLTLSGTAAGNYSLGTAPVTTTANITAKGITGTFASADKVYDGGVSAAATNRQLHGVVGSDVISLEGGSATFATKTVATGKEVTLTGAALAGADKGNYTLTSVATTTAAITPKALVIAISATDKIYNGNADAATTATIASGLVAGDEVAVASTGGQFDTKNVGANKDVTASVSISGGTDAGNYSANTTASNTAAITLKALTAASTVASKVYDGSAATGTVALGAVTGLVGTETLVITPSASNFTNANVGTAKPTTVSYVLANGTNGGLTANYSMAAIASSGDITPKSITGSFTASDKEYDGSTTATVTGRSLSGVVASDAAAVTLTGGTATFSDKNVGTDKTVTLTGASLAGIAKDNYTLASVATTTAAITAKALTVTANNITVETQYSDILPAFGYTVTGFVNGENSSIVSGQPTYTTTALLSDTRAVLSPAGVYSITPLVGSMSSDNYSFVAANGTLTITKEDATVVYSGNEYFSTASPTSSTATIALSATVTDNADGSRGDVRNATIDFLNEDLTGSFLTGSKELKVGLVNPSDFTVGTATLTDAIGLSSKQMSQGGDTYIVTSKTSGNHYSSEADVKTITVAVPGLDYVTGGFNVALNNSSGKFGGTGVSKMNGGLNMKWNSSGKNLQGQITILYRKHETTTRIVDGLTHSVTGWHTYKMKSNAINSMAVVTVTGFKKAIISTKANFERTNPEGIVESLGGGYDLSVEAWENTIVQNGSLDRIAVTLREGSTKTIGGGVLFSSNWNGTKTMDQQINGGKINVRNGAIQAPVMAAARKPTTELDLNFGTNAKFTSYPNPFKEQAIIEFAFDQEEEYSLNIYSMHGALIKTLKTGKAQAKTLVQVKWEDASTPRGVYLLRLTTKNGVQTLRLVRE